MRKQFVASNLYGSTCSARPRMSTVLTGLYHRNVPEVVDPVAVASAEIPRDTNISPQVDRGHAQARPGWPPRSPRSSSSEELRIASTMSEARLVARAFRVERRVGMFGASYAAPRRTQGVLRSRRRYDLAR